MTAILTHTYFSFLSGWILTVRWFSFLHPLRRFPKPKPVTLKPSPVVISVHLIIFSAKMIEANTTGSVTKECAVTGHVCVNSNVFYETKTDSPFAALHSDCLFFYILFIFLYRYACTIGRSRLAMIAARMQRI